MLTFLLVILLFIIGCFCAWASFMFLVGSLIFVCWDFEKFLFLIIGIILAFGSFFSYYKIFEIVDDKFTDSIEIKKS